jgi:hypothetical protein
MKMISKKTLSRPFGYSSLMLTLLAMEFIGPLMVDSDLEGLVLGVLVVMVAGSTIYAAGDSQFRRILLVLLAFALVVSHFMRALVDGPPWTMAYEVIGVVMFTYVSLLLLSKILSVRSDVSGELISGAVAVYLLLGAIFAYLFALVETVTPGSFLDPHTDALNFLYYSMVTLTTLGYGDIVPVTPVARGLGAFEAVLGQLYLTVLVARLVGMHISVGMSRKSDH